MLSQKGDTPLLEKIENHVLYTDPFMFMLYCMLLHRSSAGRASLRWLRHIFSDDYYYFTTDGMIEQAEGRAHLSIFASVVAVNENASIQIIPSFLDT